MAAQVPVGEHLADQLMLPLALTGGGAYKTMALSRHALTNRQVIGLFLDVPISVEEVEMPPNEGEHDCDHRLDARLEWNLTRARPIRPPESPHNSRSRLHYVVKIADWVKDG